MFMLEKASIGLSIFATLLALSVFVYTEYIFEKPPISAEEGLKELKEEASKISVPASFDIENIVINLRSEKSKRLRFLNLSVHLIPFSDKHRDALELNNALIHDSIIDVSGHMEPDEINSITGKILFESRLKKQINERMKADIIRDILFSKFVVQ